MRETPLHTEHVELGARFTPFAGWNMPVIYTSIVEEHHAVRHQAGLFDLCHMGRLTLTGELAALEALVPTDVAALRPGQAKYSFFLTGRGTFIDDILIYRREHDIFLVVNASNREAVLAHLALHYRGQVHDQTETLAMIAVQGPRALAIVERLTRGRPSELDYYSFMEDTLDGVAMTVARTGYTGEDGVELYLPTAAASQIWRKLLAEGSSEGLRACGLGARDTLRLEAGMALYGHEIDLETNPIEAKLNWAVAWDKPANYLGATALHAVRAAGAKRQLVGLEIDSKRVPRQGQPILFAGTPVGITTSGTASPTLDKRIAMGYVASEHARLGTALEVDIRGSHEPARVIKLPFYKRSRA
jgi:aminomethyltransferase